MASRGARRIEGDGILEAEHVTSPPALARPGAGSERTDRRVSGGVGLAGTLRTLQSTAGNRAVSALVTARRFSEGGGKSGGSRAGGASGSTGASLAADASRSPGVFGSARAPRVARAFGSPPAVAPRLRAGFGIQRAPDRPSGSAFFPRTAPLQALPSEITEPPPEFQGGARAALERQISEIVSSRDTSHDHQALRDASAGIDVFKRLTEQHWESDRARRLYTKSYLIACEQWAGRGTPSNDQLYFALLDYEKRYSEHIEREHKRREGEAATAAVRAKAASNRIPAGDFEPGWIQVPVSADLETMLSVARTDARWCDDGIIAAQAKIDAKTRAQWLRLIYNDGAVLDIPLPGTLFRQGLPQEAVPILYFRRHKSSGRVIPFETTLEELGTLAAPAASEGDVEYAIPPRFDPVLTPHIMHWFALANSEQLNRTLMFAAQGSAMIATAGGATKLGPGMTQLGAAGTETAIGTALGAGRLAGAGLAEIRLAVANYGVSRAALTYLGRSALTFYLRNAVAVNTAAILGTEFALSLAGQDMGVFTSGDQLVFAVQTDKNAYAALRVEVEEIDRSTKLVKVKRISMGTISGQEAEEIYGSGKLVHHEKASPLPVTEPAPPPAQAADQPRPPVLPAGPRPAATPTVKAAGPPLAGSIHRVQLLTDVEGAKLEARGVKREALDKLRDIEIGELERLGLRPKTKPGDDPTKFSPVKDLYRSIISSQSQRGDVVEFMNEFHRAPGFEGIVLNWAKGGKARPGASFAMRYALAKFRSQAIRFEWPVGYALTAAGEEGTFAARYVDVVVDGGTHLRPGESLRIELKNWSDWFLSKYPERARQSIARELPRDIAFFGKDNIRWVFNGADKKVTKQRIIELIIDMLRREQDYRMGAWLGGTDAQVRAALDALVEIFP